MFSLKPISFNYTKMRILFERLRFLDLSSHSNQLVHKIGTQLAINL